MLINKDTISAIFKGYNTLYKKAFTEYKPEFQKIATEVPSTAKSEDYSWLGAFPRMREWLGERQYNNLLAHAYEVINKHWEGSLKISRDDIADDKIGLFNPLASELGRATASQPDELVFALLVAGFESCGYDKVPFFSTSHKVKGRNVSNADVPSSNPGNPWFLLDTSRAIKPLIFQNRQKPEFAALTAPDSDPVYKRNEFVFGADSRNNAGYGLWQMAFGSKQPLTPANYALSRAAMMAFKDDSGKLLQMKPTLLVVGGSNEAAARKIAYGEYAAADGGMESNPWKGTIEVLVTPYLD